MNETIKFAPRPWRVERRKCVYVDKKGRKAKKFSWFLVDANGRDVWHTEANMRLVCACVNSEQGDNAEIAIESDEAVLNSLLFRRYP